MPPSVYLLVGSNPGLSDSVCVSFSDRSEASSLDLLRAFSVSLLPPSRHLVLSFFSFSLSFVLHLSLRWNYIARSRARIYTRKGVRTNCARLPAQRVGEIPLSLTGAQARSLPEERERTRRQTWRRREIPLRNLPSLSAGIYPSLSGLFLYLPSFSLRRTRRRTTTRPFACTRTCRAGRNLPPGKPHNASNSRHFAVPLAPDDTRKPNGKRKYDADFRSVETNPGNSRQIAQRYSLTLSVLVSGPPPLRFNPRFLPPRQTAPACSQSHPNAGNSTIGRDNCPNCDWSVASAPFSSFREKPTKYNISG